jgi:hypothetical protein
MERLPEVQLQPAPGTHVPPLFIVNCQLPSEAPSMMNPKDDGPGYNVVFYYALTAQTAEELKDLTKASPAVRLLNEYFRCAPTHGSLHEMHPKRETQIALMEPIVTPRLSTPRDVRLRWTWCCLCHQGRARQPGVPGALQGHGAGLEH